MNWQREPEQLNAVFPSYAERRRPLSVSVIDIDGLRALNLEAGTAVGDAELQPVAATLRRTLRTGQWLGRWGGDEFLLACRAEASVMCFDRAERALGKAKSHGSNQMHIDEAHLVV